MQMTQTHTRARAAKRRQGGFIITVELLLIATILVIGSIVGVIAIRDALVKRIAQQRSQAVLVIDDSGRVLGEALGFDEHEAPLVSYIDRTVPPAAPDPDHRNYRALIGVRDDRFTTREPVYYSGENCTGTPCMKLASDEDTDSIGYDGIAGTGAVSYLYGVQNSPTYGIGASQGGLRGDLYRSTDQFCPVEVSEIRSRYLSQRVVSGSPCEAFQLGQPGEPETSCLAHLGGVCSCPSGYDDQGDILTRYLGPIDALLTTTTAALNAVLLGAVPTVDVGEVCCPSGTRVRDDGNLVNAVVYTLLTNVLDDLGLLDGLVGGLLDAILQPLAGELYCETNASLQAAQWVPDPNDSGLNALDRFTPPFVVNLPMDQGPDSDTWISTPPDGEGLNSQP